MKNLSDKFELTPEILQGMDGANAVPSGVGRFAESGMAAGDGVDYAIACASCQAQEQGEPAAEVLHHLKYQRDQLSILIANLERLPDEPISAAELAAAGALWRETVVQNAKRLIP